MKRAFIVVVALMFVAGLTVLKFQTATGQSGTTLVGATFVPYTIRGIEKGTANKVTRERHVIEARRADGSRFRGTDMHKAVPSEASYGSAELMLLADTPRRIAINAAKHTKTTLYLKMPLDRSASYAPETDSTCGLGATSRTASPTSGGRETILGFDTVVIATAETAGPTYRHKVWKAPALNCAVLKIVEDRVDAAGQQTGHFEFSATSVIKGEPDSALFEIPASYLEQSPSERAKAEGMLCCGREAMIERQEKMYRENHARAGKP